MDRYGQWRFPEVGGYPKSFKIAISILYLYSSETHGFGDPHFKKAPYVAAK